MAAKNSLSSLRRCSLRREEGQAVVEMMIAMTVLIPLFLVIALLAQFIDIQFKTHQASRYALWERTVWGENSKTVEVAGNNVKSAKALAEEVDILFFRSPRTPIHDRLASNQNALENPLWKSVQGDSLIPELSSVSAPPYYHETTRTTPAKNVMDLMGEQGLKKFSFGLKAIRRENFSEMSVKRPLSDLKIPLMGALMRRGDKAKEGEITLADLGMSSQGAILSQTWVAPDEESLADRVSDLTLDGAFLMYAGETMGAAIYHAVTLLPINSFLFSDILPAYVNGTRLVPKDQSLILPNHAVKGRTAPLKSIGMDLSEIWKWI